MIKPIPSNTRIDAKCLVGINNDEFVAAFGELQSIVMSIYDEIALSPFEWGFPDFEQIEGYYHRVPDFLFGCGRNGRYENGALVVDSKSFHADYDVKRHRKLEMIVSGLTNHGFAVSSYGKKTQSFTVTYPDNDNVIRVLYAYANELKSIDFTWATAIAHPCHWTISKHKYGFSYRGGKIRLLHRLEETD